ncbi:MAG TPA: SRPBCC domain-containing protein [Chloroflexota bacterium]
MAPMDGILESAAERWRLRFTRRLQHSPQTVWRAIVEAEHRDTWFPQRIEGDFQVGAALRFVSEYGDFQGEVLAYEPPQMIEFTWGTDTIRLEVRPDGDGSILTLLDTFDEQGKAARDAAGWHVCLDALERELDGPPASASPYEGWQAVNARYVTQFGPAASTIGPPEMPASR